MQLALHVFRKEYMELAQPIPNHKQFCPTIAPPGWTYGGFDEGKYLFQKGDYSKGFVLMEVIDIDLTAENLALMARLGVTRSK